MNKIESKKCPKCGGEMERGETLIPRVTILPKKGHWLGDVIQAFFYKHCGYIEFYKEMKEKEGISHE